MNLLFRDAVFKGGFRPCLDVEEFEARLRDKLGLENKYASARLSLGRSLAAPTAPPPVPSGQERGKPLSGELLFGTEIDLWIAALVIDGELGAEATVENFRALVDAHWARGGRLLRDELVGAGDDETRFMAGLAELLPVETLEARVPGVADGADAPSEVRLIVGPTSATYPDNQPIDFVLNGQGTAPHIALMGKVGSGKTTTGVHLARQIIDQTRVPFLFIDPKGEFVDDDGRLTGAAFDGLGGVTAVEVGEEPIPLDFLPDPGVGATPITQAAMQFRDSIALCCKSVGNVQQDLLRSSVEAVIRGKAGRDLVAIRSQYEGQLAQAGKGSDSVVSRLNELTALRVFTPTYSAADFFARSWVLSLNAIASDELKRLVILLVLDALKGHVLAQSATPVVDGYRTLRHLLVIDEARRILAQERYQSLVDLVRQGRSNGEVVVLLSQDPSDFDGKADDFMSQLGTVVAFSCSQSQRGLRSLQGAFGRKLQPQEFTDTQLPGGVAFVKLPNCQPQRIRCWTPQAARRR